MGSRATARRRRPPARRGTHEPAVRLVSKGGCATGRRRRPPRSKDQAAAAALNGWLRLQLSAPASLLPSPRPSHAGLRPASRARPSRLCSPARGPPVAPTSLLPLRLCSLARPAPLLSSALLLTVRQVRPVLVALVHFLQCSGVRELLPSLFMLTHTKHIEARESKHSLHTRSTHLLLLVSVGTWHTRGTCICLHSLTALHLL